jgi:N-acetylglucosaminyldiphosphoundecaprenol N-acetyl-beta-D-mannosaminyltransferase
MTADDMEYRGLGSLRCSAVTQEDALAAVRRKLREESRPESGLSIMCLNAHIYCLAQRDSVLLSRLNGASLLLADGMSIVWASRWLGKHLPERCNMTELFRLFLEASEMPRYQAVLIGCTAEEVEAATKSIEMISPHCRIMAHADGFQSLEWYAEWLRGLTATPDLVLVGMGSPRSEELLELAQCCTQAKVYWHIGGGTMHFLAGSDIEAPAWMRRAGIQWLHRLIRHPSMWRRYVVGNLRFIWLVLRSANCRSCRREAKRQA